MTTSVLNHSIAIDFILAGNATVTFLNTESKNRFTFNIKKLKDKDIYFVKVLTNPEIYSFIGSIIDNKFKYSKKSKISNDAQSVVVFNYIFSHLLTNSLNDKIEIWHEGKCGKCGRQLTVPESIEAGFGSECIKSINKKEIRSIKIDKILS